MRTPWIGRRLIGALYMVSATACSGPSSAAQHSFSGIGKAKDGDSLTVGNREVRLFGVDAPEWDQSCTRAGKAWACGQEAADQLSKLVTGKQVFCQTESTDEHGRAVARCSVGSTDVNRAIVSSGYATAYRHYSSDYVAAEDGAKLAKRGLWSGTFQKPRDYRRSGDGPEPRTATRPARRAPAQDASGCVIKGNQGSNGWIYHVPGMPSYNRTNAEEMFCTEAQAQAAGYRRARVR